MDLLSNVATSTMEAEYMANVVGDKTASCIRKLMATNRGGVENSRHKVVV